MRAHPNYFETFDLENTNHLSEFDVLTNRLIEIAKDKLRDHFGHREVVRSREKIQEWQNANIYPFEGSASDPIERNERQVFDVVALNLSDYSNDFDKAPLKQRKLILQLLKAAIENGNPDIPLILGQVLDLPKETLDDLVDLLRKTSLTSVINAAKDVTNRLDFLTALQMLIFGKVSKKQLLERSQLHKIISQETWIFGEQFNLINDDRDLTAVLNNHLKLLADDVELFDPDKKYTEQTAPVVDAEGKTAIIDLMLSRRIPTPTDDERKHLIIELKRPSQPIDENVVSQIKKYAKAVALDERFASSKVEWDFLAVSNTMTPGAKLDARQKDKPLGLIFDLDEPKIRVWCKTWGEIIDEAQGRLTFYKRGLEYQANDAEAISYLKKINPNYLSEDVKEKISSSENPPQ